MARHRFTEREVIETLWHQGVRIPCFRCKRPILPSLLGPLKELDFAAQREHLHEVELGGPDIPGNCRYSHVACHDKITNGTKATTAGSSKQRIAKVKRLIRKREGAWRKSTKAWPSKKIPSRPFQKRARSAERT